MDDRSQEETAALDIVAKRAPEAQAGRDKERLLDELAPHIDAVRDGYTAELTTLSRLSLRSEYAEMAARVGDRLRAIEDVRSDLVSVINGGKIAAHEVQEAQDRLARLAEWLRRRAA